MAIGSPSITWDLKHNWQNVGLLLGVPPPNPSGITDKINHPAKYGHALTARVAKNIIMSVIQKYNTFDMTL